MDSLKNYNIVVINLERRKDRLKSITTQLERLNLPYTIFKAWDAKTIGIEKTQEKIIEMFGKKFYQWSKDDDLRLGRMGCTISHMSVMEEAISNGTERLVILEDDAIIHKTTFINTTDDVQSPWVYYLSGLIDKTKLTNTLCHGWNKIDDYKCWYCSAYLINSNLNLIQLVNKLKTYTPRAIDAMFVRLQTDKMLYLYPSIIEQSKELGSDISNKNKPAVFKSNREHIDNKKIKFIIPSKDRATLFKNRTLKFLLDMNIDESSIYVFVPNNQVDEYRHSASINIIGIDDSFSFCDTLNYIHQDFLLQDELVVRLDDDIEKMFYCVDKKLIDITKEQFINIIDKSSVALLKHNLKIAGINPTGNGFYTSNTWYITKGSYIVGAFQVFYNDKPTQLRTFSTCEDVELICKNIEKYGGLIKMNNITIKTKWFGVGGLEELRQNNLFLMLSEHEQLYNKYYEYFSYDIQHSPGKKKINIKCKFKWTYNRKNKVIEAF